MLYEEEFAGVMVLTRPPRDAVAMDVVIMFEEVESVGVTIPARCRGSRAIRNRWRTWVLESIISNRCSTL